MTDWLAYTTKHNIDLIVLATPEDGTAGPILSCQELQPMILRTTAALLTVGHRNGRPPFTRILMPTDMTPEAVPTLHHAEAAASMYDARLDILHVLSRRKYVALTRTDLLALDDAAMAPRTTKRRLRTWYRRNAHPAYTHSISTHVHVEEGDPATAITQAVHTYDSDLIVIAASQNKAREAALSPITENVLRRTTCSVLVTRPQNCHLVSAPASDSNHSAVSST